MISQKSSKRFLKSLFKFTSQVKDVILCQTYIKSQPKDVVVSQTYLTSQAKDAVYQKSTKWCI